MARRQRNKIFVYLFGNGHPERTMVPRKQEGIWSPPYSLDASKVKYLTCPHVARPRLPRCGEKRSLLSTRECLRLFYSLALTEQQSVGIKRPMMLTKKMTRRPRRADAPSWEGAAGRAG